MSILRLHRWVSLSCLAFWAMQVLTGVLIVFHWEIDDALLGGGNAPFDPYAIERRMDILAPSESGVSVGSLWESGGTTGRYDLFLDRPEGSSVVRIDGAGKILRERADGEMFANGGWIDTLVGLHHNLLSGDTGSWIVGASGILLLSNLAMGAVAGWPRGGRWRKALWPGLAKRGSAAHAYAWHRAIGLWGVLPALFLVCAGTMLVFADAVNGLVRPDPIGPSSPVSAEVSGATSLTGSKVGFASAVRAARDRYPEGKVSGVSMPSDDSPFYKVRLLQPGESRRIYGTTTVFVSATDGSVLGSSDALRDGAGRSFVDGLFPFHTGEMGGLAGRIAVLAAGFWLLTMFVLGVVLWRRRSRR
jgi:uncharacterized iron-regulated membrane protein